jgi:hypothetical protein
MVLVSPDGPLHGLPWAALPDTVLEAFLVHEYTSAAVPVPQLLPESLRGRNTPRPANEQPSLLLVGDIDFGVARTVRSRRRVVGDYRQLDGPVMLDPPRDLLGHAMGSHSSWRWRL